MDKIEKLLRRISKKDRIQLLEIVKSVIENKTKDLNIKKIKNTDFLRARHGRFRIIFHYEKEEAIIDSIRLRSKNIYKNIRTLGVLRNLD